MASDPIAEAKDQLSKLMRQADQGEDVAVTPHNKVVVRPHAAVETGRRQPDRKLVAEIIERAKSRPRLSENAVDVIRRMRDGERD